MAGAPAILWTVSYSSDQAVAHDDATGTWTFDSGMNRLKAFRIQLITLEFPLSQRSIEPAWSRFYYSEGFQVGPLGRNVRIQEIVFNPSSTVDIDAVLPLSMQYARVTAVVGPIVSIETLTDDQAALSPHALWIGPNDMCVADFWAEHVGTQPIRLVLPDLEVDLTCAALTRTSATTFDVNIGAAPPAAVVPGVLGFLSTPAVRTPAAGAALVQWIIGLFPVLNNYRATFDAGSARTAIQAVGGVIPGTRFTVRPTNANDLLFWLGYVCPCEATTAGTPQQGVGWLGSAQIPASACWEPGGCNLSMLERSPIGGVPEWPVLRGSDPCVDGSLRGQLAINIAEPAQGFRPDFPPPPGAGPPVPVLTRLCDRYAVLACQSNEWIPSGVTEIPGGWYTPVSRPSGPADPLAGEMELQMSRFRLSPPPENQQVPPGTSSIYNFAVETPWGVTVLAPIPTGHYVPRSFAQTIQTAVRERVIALGGLPWNEFTVAFDVPTSTFRISDSLARNFILRFDHPFTFNPKRIGFDAHRYVGSPVYEGDPLVLPRRSSRGSETGLGCPGWPVNWYVVSDGGAQRKFRITGQPTKTAEATAFVDGVGVECAVGAGIGPALPADAPPGSMVLKTRIQHIDSGGGLAQFPFALPYQKYDTIIVADTTTGLLHQGVVVADAGEMFVDGVGDLSQIIMVYVPGVVATDVACGWTWRVMAPAEYAPLTLALPMATQGCVNARTLPIRVLGFPQGVTAWQPDTDNTLTAPSIYDLDHPDYILMDLGFDYLRKTDSFQIAGAGGNTVAFAKLVVYPNYQVQGLLPRELISANMDSPVQFNVKFANPDGDRYFLNGRGFSFTLSYTSPVGLN